MNIMSRFNGTAAVGGFKKRNAVVPAPAPVSVDDVTLSRKLSWLLRHAAASKDLNMSRDGWVEVDQLLKLMEFRMYTKADILRVVQTNDKCRFSLRAVSAADGSVMITRCPSSPSLRSTKEQGKATFSCISTVERSRRTPEDCSENDGSTSTRTAEPTAHTILTHLTVHNTSDQSTPTTIVTPPTTTTTTYTNPATIITCASIVGPVRDTSLSPTLVNVRDIRGDLLLRSGVVLYIRATQGHSLNIVEPSAIWDCIQTPEEVPVCIHGTFLRCWQSISTSGLRRMQRTAIHFAAGFPGDDEVLSGMRRTAEVIIYLDVRLAMEDGIAFYRSENNVILSPGIDGVIHPKYFISAVDIKSSKTLM